MQVFEFHFNPRTKEGIILDSFVYEPENIYEKNLGNLFIAGQLINILPQNHQFLNNLAAAVKKNYYLISAKSSPERSFKSSLEEANNFLEKEEKKGNISWLGNLDLAIMGLKDFNLNFTKVGDIKILLARNNEIIDIGKELDSKESDLPSLKTFSNIVTGKLAPEDKIIILSKEIFNIFEKENIFSDILLIFEDNEKPKKIDWELKKILDKNKTALTEKLGLFLLIALGKFQKETLEVKKPVTIEKEFSFLLPLFLVKKFIREKIKTLFKIKNPLNRLKVSFKKIVAIKKLLNFPKKETKEDSKKTEIPVVQKNLLFKFSDLKKLLFMIIVLTVILLIGNYIFNFRKEKEIEKSQINLNEIQKIMTEAENAFIYNDLKKANSLYREALSEILALNQENEVLELKSKVEKELFSLNNLEKIPEPEIFFELKTEEFSPQKMTLSGSSFYFWNLNDSKIYALTAGRNEGKFIEVSKKIELGTKFGDYVLFFSRPNQLIFSQGEKLISSNDLEFPLSDFNPVDMSVFGSNIYFLDSQKGEIIKFRLEEEKNQLSGEIWLNNEPKKPLGAKSMTVDNSIWIVNENNKIFKYYKGIFQEEMDLDFFPSIQSISKIFTSPNLSYLYLLTPSENRLIILNKDGKIFKQYQSDKFNDLKDFTVSENGDVIYLLNGLKIYQIKP